LPTSTFQDSINEIRTSINSVVVGKKEVVDLAIVAVLCRGHILTEDVPGIGKTTLARALAGSLQCTFGRIQFTPDLMPSDVLGINWFNQKTNEFEFRKGPVFSQIVLADEINRATPRTQSALLEAMQEGQVTLDGETKGLPDPFIVIATQNPIDMEGTFPLPEAQLDRFMLKLGMGYPSLEEEEDIILRFSADEKIPVQKPAINTKELLSLQSEVSRVVVGDEIRKYLMDIVRLSRENESVSLGGSPRSSIALFKASQAQAAISGRDFVIPDDVKYLAEPVLAHRIIPTSNARLRGHSQLSIVRDVISSVSVPIERE